MKVRLRAVNPGTLGNLAVSVECSAIGDFSAEDDLTPKWVQVAEEGKYMGYRGGAQPFAFTRKSFDEAVKNLHAHPAFKLNVATGEGEADVIPWDFNHGSEADPTSGEYLVMGAPARGWTLDLKVGVNAAGVTTLMALTRFLEPARSYVKTGAYKWSSIAADLKAVHPKSGEQVGMVISSIALTNTPFIAGMEALVASANRGQFMDPEKVQARYYYSAASTAEEAANSLKELFRIPALSGLADVLLEVVKVKQWVTEGAAPLGVQLEDIIGGLRQILGLPALTPTQQVLDTCETIVQAYVEEQAVVNNLPVPPTSETVPAPVAASNQGKNQMEKTTAIVAILASKLGVRENEEAIILRATQGEELRSSLVTLFGCKDDLTVILKAATDTAASDKSVREKLAAMFKALGVENSDAAIEKLAKTMADAEQLKQVMPELEALKAKAATDEAAAVDADVAQAMTSRNFGSEMKEALLLLRKTKPEEFAKSFPKVVPPAANQLTRTVLTTSITATKPVTSGPVVKLGTQVVVPEGVIDLAQYQGANPTLRAMTYLSQTIEGWDRKSHEERVNLAKQLRRSGKVTDSTPVIHG